MASAPGTFKYWDPLGMSAPIQASLHVFLALQSSSTQKQQKLFQDLFLIDPRSSDFYQQQYVSVNGCPSLETAL